MQQNIKRTVINSVITLALIVLAVFAIAPLASPSVDFSDGAFASLGAKVAFAFGGDGGGDGGGGGGDGGGGSDGGGCCGGDTGGDTGGDGDYTPPPPPDVCPNLPGAQSSIPPGYIMDNGNCVIPPPPVSCDSFTGSPTTLPVGGGNVTLTWQTTGATSVSINQGIGAVAVDGSRVVTDVNSSRTFVLTATGAGGTDTCQVSVTVPNPTPVSCDSFTASPTNLPAGGGNVTLTWQTTGATSVSINQGIGAVAADGSRVVTNVTSSKTYVLTATGAGGTVTCSAPVTVAAQPDLACDSFTASPQNLPAGGGNVTLTWRTTGATKVTISHGIGDVAVDGSTTVHVPNARTFTLTATRGVDTVTCTVPVTVAQPNLSCDSFTGSPTNLPRGGGDVTLTWRTTGATSVSINQGIGAVAADGSRVVTNVNSSRTFVLTATRGVDTVTCTVPVTVDTTPRPLSCDSFTASPNRFGEGGGNTTLRWETTGANRVVIDQGIGEVSVDGSHTTSVSSSRTYTLTATRGDQTVTCTTSVEVERDHGGGGGSPSPRCLEFRASDTRITAGQSVTLRWETRNGTRIEIEPNVLETSDDDLVDEGEIVVRPTRSTEYELTVYRGSRKDTCEVDVHVGEVTVITDRDQQPVTSISFREIPYTGFDAGPFLTSLFYTLLALWSAIVAYILVVKRGSVFGYSLPQTYVAGNGGFMPAVETFYAPKYEESIKASVANAPMNLPSMGSAFASVWKTVPATASIDEEETTEEGGDQELMTRLENDAHAHNILLSSDAMRLIVDHGETPADAVAFLDTLIERAKATYAREDGWIVLNRERVMALLAVAPAVAEAPVAETEVVGAHTLAEAIVTGNTARAYEALTDEPLHAIADAAEALDSVLRARKAGVASSDLLARAAAHIDDVKLQAAVTALVSAIDGTYADETAAVRLAVIKALKAVA